MRARLTLALLALLVTAGAAEAAAPHAQGDHPDPGASPSFALFPQHADVTASVEKHRDHPWFDLFEVGASEKGKPIVAAAVTNPDGNCWAGRDDRPCAVTFLFTQQHGNEPAGTPALLALLDEIAAGGEAADWLSNQWLIALPMANPDGADANQRRNAHDHDINRDHMGLETAEANALHAVFNAWDVHVALDHHEYGGLGPGVPGVHTVYDSDLTALYPVHGNAGGPAVDAAKRLMYEGIFPAARDAGFTANEYGEYEVAGEPVQKVAGGPDPGIMRNHLGLHHIAGLLIETRVDVHPNPLHDAERRIAIHANVMHATLAFVHENAQAFVDAKRASEAASVDEPAREYVEGDRRGRLADAYETAMDVDATFLAHGLAPSKGSGDSFTYLATGAHRGHVAALLHPQSSRAIVDDARAVDAAPFLHAEDDALAAQSVPGPGAALVLLGLVAGVALAGRRRT